MTHNISAIGGVQDFDKVTHDLETLAKEMQEKDLAWKEERHQYEEEKM
jgi:hypothetical protein